MAVNMSEKPSCDLLFQTLRHYCYPSLSINAGNGLGLRDFESLLNIPLMCEYWLPPWDRPSRQ